MSGRGRRWWMRRRRRRGPWLRSRVGNQARLVCQRKVYTAAEVTSFPVSFQMCSWSDEVVVAEKSWCSRTRGFRGVDIDIDNGRTSPHTVPEGMPWRCHSAYIYSPLRDYLASIISLVVCSAFVRKNWNKMLVLRFQLIDTSLGVKMSTVPLYYSSWI